MNRKLGKKPGHVEDRRTLRFADFATLPKLPASTQLARGVEVPMFGNDRYGDCTCAAQGHRIVMQQHRARQHDAPALTDRDVLGVYSAVAGFDPETGANDNGAYLIDVLRHMRSKGMGRETDGTPHTVGAYVQVDVSDHDHVRAAGWMFGGLYTGVELPTSAEDQIDQGRVWSVVEDESGTAGGWGGHAMWFDGYSSARVGFRTWGMRQKATWGWWDAYVDEAWAVISEDYLRGDKTPEGFDMAALDAALKEIG